MSSVLPVSLSPYIEQCLVPSSFTLLTSVLNATVNWLVVRFLYISLRGVASGSEICPNTPGPCQVVFLSLIRPLDLWLELGKKLGLDIPFLLKTKQLTYIDGLGQYNSSGDVSTIRLKSVRLNEIQTVLSIALRSQRSDNITAESTGSQKPIVIIDGLDFVLASQPDVDFIMTQQFLSSVRTQCYALAMTSSADLPLLHNRDDSATPLENEHATFVTAMAHQSNWIMQVRGLETGTAKDITGILRVSHGGSTGEGNEGKDELFDGEWLYHIKGDGHVKLWTRGE